MDPFFAIQLVESIARTGLRARRETAQREAIARERQAFERFDDARMLRGKKLEAIGSRALFQSGLFVGGSGEGIGRPGSWVTVATTEHDFVLLDGDVEADPDGELGRVPRTEETRVEVAEFGGSGAFGGSLAGPDAVSAWAPSTDKLVGEYLEWVFGPEAQLVPGAEDSARLRFDRPAEERSLLSAARIISSWPAGQARFLFASLDGAREAEAHWRRHLGTGAESAAPSA